MHEIQNKTGLIQALPTKEVEMTQILAGRLFMRLRSPPQSATWSRLNTCSHRECRICAERGRFIVAYVLVSFGGGLRPRGCEAASLQGFGGPCAWPKKEILHRLVNYKYKISASKFTVGNTRYILAIAQGEVKRKYLALI